MPASWNPVHLRIFVLTLFHGKWRSLRQVHFYNQQKLPKSEKRQRRKETKKGLWFSDRWGGFIWLQRLLGPFRLSFGPLWALLVVKAKHVTCLSPYLKPTPAVSNKASKQYYFLSVCSNLSMAIFPLSQHFPPFPFLSGIHFYWSPGIVPSA